MKNRWPNRTERSRSHLCTHLVCLLLLFVLPLHDADDQRLLDLDRRDGDVGLVGLLVRLAAFEAGLLREIKEGRQSVSSKKES